MEFLLWGVAVGMVLFTAWILDKASMASTHFDSALESFALVMMASMFGGGLVYLSYPGSFGAEVAVWLNMGAMSAGLVPVFGIGVRNLLAGPKKQRTMSAVEAYRHPKPLRFAIAALVVGNELLMGSTLLDLNGLARTGLVKGFEVAVASYWFLVPMGLEMLLTAYLLRRITGEPLSKVMLLQGLNMLLVPTWMSGVGRQIFVVSWAVTMAFPLFYLFTGLYRGLKMAPSLRIYLIVLLATDAFESAGLVLWLSGASILIYEASILAQMYAFFYVISDPWGPSAG